MDGGVTVQKQTNEKKHDVYLGLTYPLSHKLIITAGLFEERDYGVCVSLVISGGSCRQHKRILFDFTEWNLLLLLHERITNGLQQHLSNVKLSFQDHQQNDGKEENKVKSVLLRQGCVYVKDTANTSIVIGESEWTRFVNLLPILRLSLIHIYLVYCLNFTNSICFIVLISSG